MQIEILFEDDALLILNKHAGVQVEQDKWKYPSVEEYVFRYLEQKMKTPFVGIVHRIDRPVSGALIVAKKRGALKILNEAFRDKLVKKNYFAIVESVTLKDKDILQHWIKRDEQNKLAIVTLKKSEGSFFCELNYQVITKNNQFSLLEINPITGKFHQIRAQLSFIGSPVVGDLQYGSKIEYKKNEICLHASYIELNHPITKQLLQIKAPVPHSDQWKSFATFLV